MESPLRLSIYSASPEEFLSGEEAGYCDHQQCYEQASEYAPERRAEAYFVEPREDAAEGENRTGQEVCDGVCEHRILSASAQSASLYVPSVFQSEYECSGKSSHSAGREHI